MISPFASGGVISGTGQGGDAIPAFLSGDCLATVWRQKTSRDAAELVNCPVCWVQPGEPCDMRVTPLWWEAEAGYHFPRLKRARRKLGAGRAQRLAELSGLRHFELLAMVQAREWDTRFRGSWAGDYWWARQSRDRLIEELLP